MLHGARLCQWGRAPRLSDSDVFADELLRHRVAHIAPFQTAKYEKVPWTRWLVENRRRIETTLAQLLEIYSSKPTWARDLWHLSSRRLRKILSHTMAILLCQQHGLGSLAFSQLIAS